MEEVCKRLMGMGYAFVCSCCDRLPLGIVAGRQGCGVDAGECGGPLLGRSFPKYEGPLTIHTRGKLCFRCGDKGKVLLRTRDGGYVAVCERHLSMFPEIKVKDQVVSREAIRG